MTKAALRKKYPTVGHVPGVGAGKLSDLDHRFKSEAAVLAASISELREVVSYPMARKIFEAAKSERAAFTPDTEIVTEPNINAS